MVILVLGAGTKLTVVKATCMMAANLVVPNSRGGMTCAKSG